MKTWQSLLIGALVAAGDTLLQLASVPTFDFTDWKAYLRPLIVAALTAVIAKAKTSTPPTP
jgi:hypothetical protein